MTTEMSLFAPSGTAGLRANTTWAMNDRECPRKDMCFKNCFTSCIQMTNESFLKGGNWSSRSVPYFAKVHHSPLHHYLQYETRHVNILLTTLFTEGFLEHLLMCNQGKPRTLVTGSCALTPFSVPFAFCLHTLFIIHKFKGTPIAPVSLLFFSFLLLRPVRTCFSY